MNLDESCDLSSDNTKLIEQNQKLNFKIKTGGPYSKIEQEKRRQEVYKLHFEYGYSARKISELMNMNRNTINRDIEYWYSKIFQSITISPEDMMILNIQRLEIQRSRLREQLDKINTFQEKMALERLMYEIDSKILYTYGRATESIKRMMDYSTDRLNTWMENHEKPERFMTLFDMIAVSKKACQKIIKIIDEDKSQGRFLKD
ncbi:MAG: hypothetical protein ACREAD_02020 [Nitrosopumilaceae archaeon]